MTWRGVLLLLLTSSLSGCPAPAPEPQPPPTERRRALRPRPAPVRPTPVVRPAPPRPRRPALPPASRWKAQKDAWTRLLKAVEPLAKKGAWLPTPKLRKHFRRRGVWHHPSFDPSKLTAGQRMLLSPTGPATHRDVNGPAGRAVYVTGQAPELCAETKRRCGLVCTEAPALGLRGDLRRRVRFLRDHDAALRYSACRQPDRILAPRTSGPRVAWLRGPLDRLEKRVLDLARDQGWRVQRVHWATVIPELTLCTKTPWSATRRIRVADGLCRLVTGTPNRVHDLWFGSPETRALRSKYLAKALGLTFLERPVDPGRPPLERTYIRRHYRDRVFNIRRRASDRAHLIRPLMVVLHHTGSTKLSSALYTLRAKRLGSRGRLHNPRSVGVGVPYLTARDGRIFRLFKDDSRFGRHTIGLNHSAIGIENVGNKHHPLTATQVERNARLIEYIAQRHPIRWIIGHREVYQMARTGYYLEAVPGYCSSKADPTWRALRAVRKRVAYLGFQAPPTTRPVLHNCRQMRRYFKKLRRSR